MKKALFNLEMVIFLCLSSSLYGQRIGFKGGMNFARQKIMVDGNNILSIDGVTEKKNVGFQFGPILELKITKNLFFEPGLLISKKGSEIKEVHSVEGRFSNMELKTELYYLDVPLVFKRTVDLNTFDWYGSFGPMVSVGLAGNQRMELVTNNSKQVVSQNVNWGPSKQDLFRRTDFGLLFGTGIEVRNLQFGMSYNLGLANVSSFDDTDSFVKNRVFSINAAYLLGD